MQEKALKKKLVANQQEHEYQQELRKQYEAIQPLSGVTHSSPDDDKN
jgi:protein PET117